MWEATLRRLELGRTVSQTHRTARQRTFAQMENETRARVEAEVKAEVIRRGDMGKQNHASVLSQYMQRQEAAARRSVSEVESAIERSMIVPAEGAGSL